MKKEMNGNARVLLIDDDELNSNAFGKRLERKGFIVKLITSGHDVLNLLVREHFDIVLLDIVLPDIDGISILKQIREKYPAESLPVIMVTAIDDSTDILDAFEYGANDYITKPVSIDAAAARINGQLSTSALYLANTKLQQVEAVAALVITFHHKINNPLAIVKSELQLLEKEPQKTSSANLEKMLAAVNRIESTLQNLQEISENTELAFEIYGDISKMVKIND